MKNKFKKAWATKLKKILNDENYTSILLKLVMECWNAERPHFGGAGPHRYNDNDKECCYCGRPKDWSPQNAGYYTGEILYGSLSDNKEDKVAS